MKTNYPLWRWKLLLISHIHRSILFPSLSSLSRQLQSRGPCVLISPQTFTNVFSAWRFLQAFIPGYCLLITSHLNVSSLHDFPWIPQMRSGHAVTAFHSFSAFLSFSSKFMFIATWTEHLTRAHIWFVAVVCVFPTVFPASNVWSITEHSVNTYRNNGLTKVWERKGRLCVSLINTCFTSCVPSLIFPTSETCHRRRYEGPLSPSELFSPTPLKMRKLLSLPTCI